MSLTRFEVNTLHIYLITDHELVKISIVHGLLASKRQLSEYVIPTK